MPQSWNRYSYGLGNPVKYVDPDGRVAETAWDVFNIGIGVASFVDNVRQGNVGAAVLDGVGVVADAGATLLPVVPGGAGSAIRVYRAADRAGETAGAVSAGARGVSRGAREVGNALEALPAGRSAGVKVVASGDELTGLFDRLSSGGKTVEGTTYPGRLVELPDGTTIGLRPESTSGGPTIDIKLSDGTLGKVHVQE